MPKTRSSEKCESGRNRPFLLTLQNPRDFGAFATSGHYDSLWNGLVMAVLWRENRGKVLLSMRCASHFGLLHNKQRTLQIRVRVEAKELLTRGGLSHQRKLVLPLHITCNTRATTPGVMSGILTDILKESSYGRGLLQSDPVYLNFPSANGRLASW